MPELEAEVSQNKNEHELEEVLVGQEHTQATMKTASAVQKERKSIFDKWSEKLKDFLDNAE
jgi:cell division protein FtsA